jgi:hypothetical protein
MNLAETIGNEDMTYLKMNEGAGPHGKTASGNAIPATLAIFRRAATEILEAVSNQGHRGSEDRGRKLSGLAWPDGRRRP